MVAVLVLVMASGAFQAVSVAAGLVVATSPPSMPGKGKLNFGF
jgi:hypothetical protein